MQFDYKYSFPQEEAKARLELLGAYLANRHGIHVAWEGNKASFNGKYLVVKINGELTVADGIVHFNGQDPGMLWRKKAVEYLRGKLATYLDPNTPMDQLPRAK